MKYVNSHGKKAYCEQKRWFFFFVCVAGGRIKLITNYMYALFNQLFLNRDHKYISNYMIYISGHRSICSANQHQCGVSLMRAEQFLCDLRQTSLNTFTCLTIETGSFSVSERHWTFFSSWLSKYCKYLVEVDMVVKMELEWGIRVLFTHCPPSNKTAPASDVKIWAFCFWKDLSFNPKNLITE